MGDQNLRLYDPVSGVVSTLATNISPSATTAWVAVPSCKPIPAAGGTQPSSSHCATAPTQFEAWVLTSGHLRKVTGPPTGTTLKWGGSQSTSKDYSGLICINSDDCITIGALVGILVGIAVAVCCLCLCCCYCAKKLCCKSSAASSTTEPGAGN